MPLLCRCPVSCLTTICKRFDRGEKVLCLMMLGYPGLRGEKPPAAGMTVYDKGRGLRVDRSSVGEDKAITLIPRWR